MKNKNKIIISTSLILGVLVLMIGISLAVFTYQGTTTNQQLVLGDIYMHYTEKNQINLDNAIPEEGIKVVKGYIPNPVMATQDATDESTELYACINYFQNEVNWGYGEGESIENFCRGTGTTEGIKFQGYLDLIDLYFDEILKQKLIELNIVLQPEDIFYTNMKVNPVIATQNINDTESELYACVDYFRKNGWELSDGETWEAYCRGTNAKFSLQEDVDSFGYSDYFHLLDKNVIIKEINLPYFEFTISGKNTYKGKDIWYEILLQHGSLPEEKTEDNRIKDDSLKFTLIEIDGENHKVLLDAKKYSNLENKRIWVETISKDTKNEINKTYRLYMWIDDNIVIGNVNQDYTMDEWKDVFASIKVGVTGDFNEKQLDYESLYNVTDAKCFETEFITNYTHNANMTEEELNACINYFSTTPYYGSGFSEYLISKGASLNTFCQGTVSVDGGTFQYWLDEKYFFEEDLVYFAENNIIIPSGVAMSIVDYDIMCGDEVVIPKTIGDYTVTAIGEDAFQNKYLRKVIIPDSVRTIGPFAFYDNKLTSVTFEENSKLKRIESLAFYGTDHTISEVTIPNSVIYLACNAFDNDVIIHKSDGLTCIVPMG